MTSNPGLRPDTDDPTLVGVDLEQDPTPTPPSLQRSSHTSSMPVAVAVPASWLDALVREAGDLPFEAGRDAVLDALKLAIERIAPHVFVGVRLSSVSASTPTMAGPACVLLAEPPPSDDLQRSARMFPEARHERSIALPRGCGGGRLHFASDTDALDSDGSPCVHFMARAATVVGQAMARVRAEDRLCHLEAELRAAEALAVQAEKLASLGQIAAGMVHELNNPLTSIAAYTDFLLRRMSTRAGADQDDIERLGRIAESANRMLRFTRDIVSYARPSGDVPFALDLHTVIDRALAFCDHEIQGAGVIVHRELAKDVGRVRGLPEQLAQVFVNLITNACHAMARPSDDDTVSEALGAPAAARSPILTLSTARVAETDEHPERVSVVVQDTGCGIRADHLALIFNPFFTTKRAGLGTGLGLSIVKNIVAAHGGEIRAESDMSVGTRFILTFQAETG